MADRDRAERDLDLFWDAVVAGAGVDGGTAVDPEQAETLRRFQALARTPVPEAARARAWQRLGAPAGEPAEPRPATARTDWTRALGAPDSQIGPNGRVASSERPSITFPGSRGRHRWTAARVATAVMLLATVLGVAFVFRPREGEDIRIAAPADPTTEVLAEVAVDGLPADGLLYIHRWSLRSGAAASDDSDGVTFGSVEQGQVGVRIGDEPERVLGPGATFVVAPGATYAVRAVGADQVVYRETRITDEHWSQYALFDPMQGLSEGMGDHTLAGLPSTGPAEVALVRLTLDPGEVLDGSAEGVYYQAIVVEAGALGVDYLRTEDPLAPGAAPTYEQTLRVGPAGPPVGTDDRYREAPRVVGNAGEEPLVLQAVRITPRTEPSVPAPDDAAP